MPSNAGATVRLVRNATTLVTVNDKTFLVDPLLITRRRGEQYAGDEDCCCDCCCELVACGRRYEVSSLS